MNTQTIRTAAPDSVEQHPKKNGYYFSFVTRLYRLLVPTSSRVLHIGCKDGYLLHVISPAYGVGIDDNPIFIEQARNRNPQYAFQLGMKDYVQKDAFDYIIISASLIHTSSDVQALFESVKRFCAPETRMIVEWHSYFWEPFLMLARRMGFFYCDDFINKFSTHNIEHFLQLAGFEVVSHGKNLIMPWYIPGLSWLCNSFLSLFPGVRSLGMFRWSAARVTSGALKTETTQKEPSVSVIITCRNEKGNIEAAMQRCPQLGSSTEYIFVEGHSNDGTLEEIYRVQKLFSDKNISVIVQTGKGKGDAVRAGFAAAQGDILMILDGDLTVAPEDMTKFYQALVQRKGEFINGSRLVYGMESQAMIFLALLANHFFSRCFSWILGQRVTDTLCGTKVMYKKDYLRIMRHRAYFGNIDPFGDFDLLLGAARLNCKIIDMPIHYKNRVYGATTINKFKELFPLLKMSYYSLKKFKAP